MRRFAIWLLLCVVCMESVGAAQNHRAVAAVAEQSEAQQRADVTVPLIGEGLRLSDFPDMAPRADLKSRLGEVTEFIQNSPNDGKAATEETEVWMAHTTGILYFVFVCHDRHPALIRGHLARRENTFSDDSITVLLDPFQDRRTGVLFRVNSAGVEADASWSEANGSDFSYDTVWDSDGVVTKDGWMALVAIPFRSLRFHRNQSDWGVVFSRNLPRNSESDYWPRVAANVSGLLTQEGILHGIEGVTGSHNLQLNPYALAQNERQLIDVDPTHPFFSSRHLEGTAGGEAKLILRDSIVLDATVNPDFSDVESEQPQFTVNQRYPVYFPELRPFFLENGSYFSTPITLVYTRNIVHPEYGIRMTGKIDHTNVGIFAIDDRQPGQTVAPGDPLYNQRVYNQRAKFVVGRVAEDLGKGSSIGAIYTDEEFGGGWNRIGGIDGTVRFNEHWTAMGQMVESSTRGTLDSGSPPAYSAGPGSNFQLSRNGHAFNMYSNYQDYSTGFETQLGFIQASNFRNGYTHAGYGWFPKHSRIQSFGLEADQNVAFNHQGDRVFRYSSFDPYWLLPRRFVVAPIFGTNSDTVSPSSYSALSGFRNFTQNYGGLIVRGAPWSQFNFNLRAFRGGNVNYNPVAGAAPSLLDQETVSVLFTVQPIRQLTIDNTYLLDRDRAASTGAFVYETQTMRTKINFQFTRSLSARLIAEYDSTLVNPAQTSLVRTRQVPTQVLLTWLPHPGTSVYIGYSNDMQNLDRSLCNRVPGGACDPNHTSPPRGGPLLNDGRQVFVKASYLFRF